MCREYVLHLFFEDTTTDLYYNRCEGNDTFGKHLLNFYSTDIINKLETINMSRICTLLILSFVNISIQ